MANTTKWKPWQGDGALPAHVYAFPKQRIDPLIDATDVRSALSHIHEIGEVSDEERRLAFDNIKSAAEHFHVAVDGDTYDEMCRRPQPEVAPRD
jgi:hypothetical protein